LSQFLAGENTSAMDHPPYSPDLASADFWLFLELKCVLRGKRFSVVEDIKSSVKKKNLRASLFKIFKNCFEQWPEHWELEGDYFE
jgi:hypothetical protein